VNIDQNKQRAFAMPLTAPSYPWGALPVCRSRSAPRLAPPVVVDLQRI